MLVLDEPTNHLDLESIEALVEGLQEYEGTLIFVSHDRWFVSRLANRVVEISADRDPRLPRHLRGVRPLPAATTTSTSTRSMEKERSRKSDGEAPTTLPSNRAAANATDQSNSKSAPTEPDRPDVQAGRGGSAPVGGGSESVGGDSQSPPVGTERGRRRDPYKVRKLEERRDELTLRIDRAEARLGEIEQAFADPGLYAPQRQEEVRSLEEERTRLEGSIEKWMAEWESARARHRLPPPGLTYAPGQSQPNTPPVSRA